MKGELLRGPVCTAGLVELGVKGGGGGKPRQTFSLSNRFEHPRENSGSVRSISTVLFLPTTTCGVLGGAVMGVYF